MHEIVTLQFGPLANYVGTHFWNTQESYFTYNSSDEPSIVDHDISFRPGIAADGTDTYTPRALIYDLKQGFGSLRKINALYEIDGHGLKGDVWTDQQTLQTAIPVVPSAYQEALESGLPTSQVRSRDVRYWSDYNRVYYHPRSLIQLTPQSLTSQLSAFELHSAGSELFRDLNQESGGVFDRDLRPFVEECDSLQGFQIYSTADDAWGGFSSRYVEELEEDFGKKSVWVWSLEDGQRVDRAKQLRRLANSTQTLSAIADKATAYMRMTGVPASLPSYVEIEPSSLWSTGALISSVVESVTLPTRLRTGSGLGAKMAFIEDPLHGESHHKIWSVSARARSARTKHENQSNVTTNSSNDIAGNDSRMQDRTRQRGMDDIDTNDDNVATPFDIDLTPSLPQVASAFPSFQRNLYESRSSNHYFAQCQSLRMSNHGSSQITNISRQQRLHYHDEETTLNVYQTPLAFPLLDSFPQSLFSISVPRTANQSNGHTLNKTLDVDTALSVSSATKFDLITLRDLVVGPGGRAMGLVDVNEREALYDDLTKMAESYSYGYEDEFSDENDEHDD